MNVYDFDDTIYKGDSSKDFIIYTAIHHPYVIIKTCPNMCISAVLYLIGRIEKKEMKEKFFYFVTLLKDIDSVVSKFWDAHQHKIKNWYLEQKEDDDVIISASPSFLLKDICKRLNIECLMATEYDVIEGKIYGENCKGEEKVVRFYEQFPKGCIDCFYSDSITDQYLAREAKESFLVRGNQIVKWSDIKG